MSEFKRLKPEFTILNPKRLYKRDGIFWAMPDRLLSVGSTEAHAILEIKNAAYWSKDKRTMAAYQVQSIVRDEELIERMRDTAQMFWENHIEPRTPPE